MSIPGIDALRELRRHLNGDAVEEVPDGFYTTTEFAESWSMTTQNAGELLRRAVATGRAEVKQIRIRVAGGVRSVRHYRLLT